MTGYVSKMSLPYKEAELFLLILIPKGFPLQFSFFKANYVVKDIHINILLSIFGHTVPKC